MRRIAPVAAFVLLLAACGSTSTPLYTRQATSACLTKQGVKVAPVTNAEDFVANSATGGAFRAQLADNFVTVSFGVTLKDASNLDAAYEQFHARKVGLTDVLRTQNNAVMLWHVHPSDADISTITGCLQK